MASALSSDSGAKAWQSLNLLALRRSYLVFLTNLETSESYLEASQKTKKSYTKR